MPASGAESSDRSPGGRERPPRNATSLSEPTSRERRTRTNAMRPHPPKSCPRAHALVRLTILAFSGERERERSDRRVRPPATPVWVDCSILDTPTQLGMIEAGHAPAGYESATRSARRSLTCLRACGCAFARNEYSGKAASPALRIAFAGRGAACPDPILNPGGHHARRRVSVRRLRRDRLG